MCNTPLNLSWWFLRTMKECEKYIQLEISDGYVNFLNMYGMYFCVHSIYIPAPMNGVLIIFKENSHSIFLV